MPGLLVLKSSTQQNVLPKLIVKDLLLMPSVMPLKVPMVLIPDLSMSLIQLLIK